MSQATTNPYLKTQVMTASPQQLRLMLYEGAIKFIRQGCQSLENSDFEASYHGLMRSQKIVLELSSSLNFDIEPELCSKLSSLYTYIYRLLVDANIERKIEPALEALELLEYEKQTWKMLIEQAASEAATEAAPAAKTNMSFNQSSMTTSSLSLNG